LCQYPLLQLFCLRNATVQLAAVSATNFKEEEHITLSTNFAPRKAAPPYPVRNSKDAVVGNLIGNGLSIIGDQQLRYFEVCIPIDPTLQQNAESSFRVLGIHIITLNCLLIRLCAW
jgi:hypothetical protein